MRPDNESIFESTHIISAFSEIGTESVPLPQKRSATFLDPFIALKTYLIISVSPDFVGCKNPPGGG